jgi:hypothetical protein
MAAQRAHPAQQLPALLLVDQRNQLEADLERQLFQRSSLARSEPCACSAFFFSRPRSISRPEGRLADGLRRDARRPRRARRHGQKGQLGQPRNQAHGRRDQAGQIERRRLGQNCWRISPPSIPAELARVSVMPPATETSSEGISVTSPSPTVSTV